MSDDIHSHELLRDVSLLDSIINTAPDAIITISDHGIIRSFSPAAEKMFGYDATDIIGQNINILMPEPDRKEHDDHLQRYRRTGEKHIIGIGREIKAMRRSGEVFSAELAVGELTLDGVRIFTGFIRDISDRVEAIGKADALQRELAHLSRVESLGEMSTSLAHELNQPLGALSNYAKAAKRFLDSDPPNRDRAMDLLDEISRQARRAGEILKRMRDFIRRVDIEPKAESIADVAREAVKMVQINAKHNNVDIDLTIADALPDVFVDRVQVQQVVVNLLRNAIDALIGEGAQPAEEPNDAELIRHIVVDVIPHDERQILVSVADNGPGLNDAALSNVFEPFWTTKQSGLGVGLSICRSIVDSHGGEIWAEEADEGGARFCFTLPIGSAE